MVGKQQLLCTDKTFDNSSTAFDLLENLKSETVDISLSSLLGEDISVVSSPESYLSNSEDLEELITPTDKKKIDFTEVNNFFSDSFLSETTPMKQEKEGKLKRRRDKQEKMKPQQQPLQEDSDDPKKQQRLIKNRESAQASRERKKVYLKDLEKTVDSLQFSNKDLSTKISSLEDENNKLREQLLRAARGEKITEIPPPKKQKMNENQKIPLPSYQQMPFLHPTYWLQMFNGGKQQEQNPNWQSTGPKVVLFVALFCVALFIVKSPHDKDMEVNHQRVGRILQQTKEQIGEGESLKELFEALSGDSKDSKIQEALGKVKIKWNKETDNLTFVFPDQETESEITISKGLFSNICEKMEQKKLTI